MGGKEKKTISFYGLEQIEPKLETMDKQLKFYVYVPMKLKTCLSVTSAANPEKPLGLDIVYHTHFNKTNVRDA